MAEQERPLTAGQLASAALKADDVHREVQKACELLGIQGEGKEVQALADQLAGTARDGIALRALLRQPSTSAAVGVCVATSRSP